MAGKTAKRRDLVDAVHRRAGLSREDAAQMTNQVLAEICSTLATGETVMLSGFGLFEVRTKAQRVGQSKNWGPGADRALSDSRVPPLPGSPGRDGRTTSWSDLAAP